MSSMSRWNSAVLILSGWTVLAGDFQNHGVTSLRRI
jgi:hypothetical protein